MLTKQQKSQLKQLIQSPSWAVVEVLVNEFCEKQRQDPALKETEWETLKTVLLVEGQVRGVRNFIQEVYLQTQDVERGT